MSDRILEVTGLTQHFKAGRHAVVHAVDGVSFSIRRGETLGLVGESGCGKTTVGRTILHLYKPTSGEVWYDGKRLESRADIQEFRKKATMVFQDPYSSLNPRMTVSDIIGEPLDIHKLCASKQEREERILELMGHVGLNSEHASRYAHEFSGGQRQRIGIARALIMEPEFIIADEPISALDVSIRAQVLNLMSSLQAERGLTYLFIAHDLSVVRFISDRIGVIYHGQLMELAESEELFSHPLHPYTRALLSAIPMPDPVAERNKKLVVYDPTQHGYTEADPPLWTELTPGHFVRGSQRELEEYRKML